MSAIEPEAQETLFLPRDRGDLRILFMPIQGQTLRIKYLVIFRTKDNNNIWTYVEDTGYFPQQTRLRITGNFYAEPNT